MPKESPTLADAPRLVDDLLCTAVAHRASDIHVEPTAAGYELRYRLDGLLQPAKALDTAAGRSLVNRLMVLAHLLTYRQDIPQEGRASVTLPGRAAPLDLRIAVMPTTHGLRAAIRLPADLIQPQSLDDLGLPSNVLSGLHGFAGADAGMLVLSGPAGSGKTTTIYALLRHIAETRPGLSIISLEDPVERDLAGITQIEITPFGELTYDKALRSVLRQDPQVLMLGEIRDAATATLAVQAALSGHRLICTLHAAHPWGALARLTEMGLEPYQLTSSVFAIVTQRLLRRREKDQYHGRVPVAEIAFMDDRLRKAVLARTDPDATRSAICGQATYASLRQSAEALVSAGITDSSEVMRVLGP
jgi:general secretion pathway protein E